ncbi:hypothetical protein NQ318_009920 [Aromia moschata]|uniref:Uncharacterized protein n=1 Tax=Aromia moschata TaxID=1265417 RepID=A0AAV8YB69_9CUCU|nr:hypothetical protein NQ318_009920 [Aromia moschata]
MSDSEFSLTPPELNVHSPSSSSSKGSPPVLCISQWKMYQPGCGSSATLLVESGGDLMTLKKHGGWRLSTVAEGYFDESVAHKTEIANKVLESVAVLTRFRPVFVLQFSKMVYLTGMHKITILQMIGYGDRRRTQAEVVRLFQEKYPELPPISQGTVELRSLIK